MGIIILLKHPKYHNGNGPFKQRSRLRGDPAQAQETRTEPQLFLLGCQVQAVPERYHHVLPLPDHLPAEAAVSRSLPPPEVRLKSSTITSSDAREIERRRHAKTYSTMSELEIIREMNDNNTTCTNHRRGTW